MWRKEPWAGKGTRVQQLSPQSLAAPAKFPENVSDKELVLVTCSHPATISDLAAITKWVIPGLSLKLPDPFVQQKMG
ncbi:hypothetical protein CB1_000490077 [Camelus ferus]|nr:hypothetical protein CB1_000490077 [Camelus ferus]